MQLYRAGILKVLFFSKDVSTPFGIICGRLIILIQPGSINEQYPSIVQEDKVYIRLHN